MTAILTVFDRDRVHLLVDGAAYTNEGMPLAFTQKAVAMPALGAVVALQGTAFAPGFLAQAWSAMFLDFDDMLDRVEGVFAAEYRQLREMQGGHVNVKPIRIVVAGWSAKAKAPAGFVFDNANPIEMFAHLDPSPGEWVAVPDLSDREMGNLARQNVMRDFDFVGRFDPARHGVAFMEAQRRMPIVPQESTTGTAVPIVGGYILASTVTVGEITQRVVHRWKDDIGRIIQPDVFSPPTSERIASLDLSGMSRQQRRTHVHRQKAAMR